MNSKQMMELNPNTNKLFDKLVKYCMVSGAIDPELYTKFDVKRGLRDINGKGVLTGLTEISDVVSYKNIDGQQVPCEGELYYHGYNVCDLIEQDIDKRFLFEEATYLLLTGELPTQEQLDQFINILGGLSHLSGNFVRDVIMKAPSSNIMNALQKSIVTLYSYDEEPEDISIPNVLRQSLQLIAKMPIISAYAYQSYMHFRKDDVLIIRNPDKKCSIAENILRMLRPDGKYTELEAKTLDIALVLHADHGGGNNSTFTTHVVTSSGTDTYSAVAAAVASLKGPRHGGANIKVKQMLEDIKEHIDDIHDEEAISNYLDKILEKEAFDNLGLIYGIGHAVYTISDPREVVLKKCAKELAEAKGLIEEFNFLDRVERIAKEVITSKRKMYKPICANVDFYSGFVYTMLGIPDELFTPMFSVSRISGWSAHRLEELVNKGKIIRPAYKYVGDHKDYVSIDKRG